MGVGLEGRTLAWDLAGNKLELDELSGLIAVGKT
jgi:hypothetical protein